MFNEMIDTTEVRGAESGFWASASRFLSQTFLRIPRKGIAASSLDHGKVVDRVNDHSGKHVGDFELFDSTLLENSDVLLFGSTQDGCVLRSSAHFKMSRRVVSAADQDAAENFLKKSDAKVRLLVVSISDIDTAMDWLLRIRQQDPRIVTIVTSPDFSRNELTTIRSCMCDASLREPVTPTSLSMGIVAAINNQHEMMQRQLN